MTTPDTPPGFDDWRGIGDDDGEHYGSLTLEAGSRKLLAELMSTRRRSIVWAVTLLVAVNGAALTGPYLVKVAIDKGIPALTNSHSATPILLVISALCALALIQAVLDYASSIAIGRVGQDILFDLRRRVFDHIQQLGLAFHERFTSGRIIARLTSDMESIDSLLGSGLQILVSAALTIAGSIVVLFILDWRLALVVVAFVPAIALITIWFRRNAFAAYRRTRETVALVIIHFVESLRGVAAVQAFRREPRNSQILSVLNEQYRQAKQCSTRLLAVYGPSVRALGNVSMAAVLFVGGKLVFDGSMTVGVLAAFLLYLRRMIEPVMDLSQFYDQFQASSAALEKLSNVLAEPPRVPAAAEPIVLTEARGDIHFDHVYFGYNDERVIIEDLELSIPAGQTVAILGATGAGKSTLAKLLARFYDPTSGSITLDGVDLRSQSVASLRAHMAMVTQENFLFSDTIAENIAFGRPDAERHEIEAAARAIGADAFIDALPRSYDTEVGKRGAQLSAGERQLISFARAFLARPQVLILDEATSSLDIPSERLVQQALEVLLADRTALIIAHRLSTVEIADRVIVLESGQVTEDGTPFDLLSGPGHFRSLYDAWQASLR